MAYETVDVRKLTGGCGAEVLGVDLNALSNSQWAEVQRAYAEFGVIFFRDQRLTPEQHIAFARRWAPIDINRFFTPVEGHPEIAEVRKEPEQKTNIGGGWHTDHSYDKAPAMGSVLLARELPEEGGDTLFANMYRAFETLSPGLQKTLEGMNAVHGSAHIFGAKGYHKNQPESGGRFKNEHLVGDDVVHPVVIRHPLSGRKALYVGSHASHIVGMPEEAGRALLLELLEFATREDWTYLHHWQVGDLVMYDNRAVLHRARPYAMTEHARVLHRTTVAGEGPTVQ